MLTNGKPLRRRLGFEMLTLAATGALLTGLGRTLARTLRPTPRGNDVASDSLVSLPLLAGLSGAMLAAPLFFYPRRTFKNRAVVITGGSRGLGLALARRLLKQGAVVTLLARDGEELDRAKALLHEQVPGTERKIFCISCDVTDDSQLENAFAEAKARFGRIDALINNAGAISIGPFEALAKSDFDAQINLHLRTLVESVRLIRPYLHQARGGHIVNVTSIGAMLPVPHMSAYNASKFGAAGFSESIAAELREENICVTTVYPGLMRTGSPIQAVFKGDAAAEYAWFSAGDNLPFLSMSADCAAARILKAAADGQSSFVLSAPAKLGRLVHALWPESYAFLMEQVAKTLPHSRAQIRKTGAQSREDLAERGVRLPTEVANRLAGERNNQSEKRSGEFNLGVTSL